MFYAGFGRTCGQIRRALAQLFAVRLAGEHRFERASNLQARADVKERVTGMGAVPVGDSPAEFQAYIDNERRRLADVIQKTGIVLAD